MASSASFGGEKRMGEIVALLMTANTHLMYGIGIVFQDFFLRGFRQDLAAKKPLQIMTVYTIIYLIAGSEVLQRLAAVVVMALTAFQFIVINMFTMCKGHRSPVHSFKIV